MNKFYVYIYLDQNGTPFYVGKGINGRWRPHLRHSRQNSFLYNKLRKIGVENVAVSFALKNVCEECAHCCEIDLIATIGRRDLEEGTLCNLTDGGEGNSGYVFSEKTKRKMSFAKKGKPGHRQTAETKEKIKKSLKNHSVSQETRGKISTSNTGSKRTEETKRKMRKAHKGRVPWNKGKKMPEGFGERVANSLRGHTISEITKQKISKANKGKSRWNKGIPCSDSTKRKISKANKNKPGWNKGIPHSEETKQKISRALKRRE